MIYIDVSNKAAGFPETKSTLQIRGTTWCDLLRLVATCCDLLRLGATWCDLVRLGATWCDLVRLGATWCDVVRRGATWCDVVRRGATWCDVVRRGATWCDVGRRIYSCHSFYLYCTSSVLLSVLRIEGILAMFTSYSWNMIKSKGWIFIWLISASNNTTNHHF